MQTTMKYHFSADNHACTCVVVPVNGFGSENLTNNTTHRAGFPTVVIQTVLGHPKASLQVLLPYCLMISSCIHTLL